MPCINIPIAPRLKAPSDKLAADPRFQDHKCNATAMDEQTLVAVDALDQWTLLLLSDLRTMQVAAGAEGVDAVGAEGEEEELVAERAAMVPLGQDPTPVPSFTLAA